MQWNCPDSFRTNASLRKKKQRQQKTHCRITCCKRIRFKQSFVPWAVPQCSGTVLIPSEQTIPSQKKKKKKKSLQNHLQQTDSVRAVFCSTVNQRTQSFSQARESALPCNVHSPVRRHRTSVICLACTFSPARARMYTYAPIPTCSSYEYYILGTDM